jgi:hypothetical protein
LKVSYLFNPCLPTLSNSTWLVWSCADPSAVFQQYLTSQF